MDFGASKFFPEFFSEKAPVRAPPQSFGISEQLSRGARLSGQAGQRGMITPGSGDVRNEHHYEAIAYLITWLVAYLFG